MSQVSSAGNLLFTRVEVRGMEATKQSGEGQVEALATGRPPLAVGGGGDPSRTGRWRVDWLPWFLPISASHHRPA